MNGNRQDWLKTRKQTNKGKNIIKFFDEFIKEEQDFNIFLANKYNIDTDDINKVQEELKKRYQIQYEQYDNLEEAYNLVKSSLGISVTIGHAITSLNQFDTTKTAVDFYLTELYKNYLLLKRQHPNKSVNNFGFSSLYLVIMGKIKENLLKPKIIDVNYVAFRFSDHKPSKQKINYGYLRETINIHWQGLNRGNIISNRNRLNRYDLKFINKHNDIYYDFNVDRITNKSYDFKSKSTGKDIRNELIQNGDRWEVTLKFFKTLKASLQSNKLLENINDVDEKILVCSYYSYD
jgi:hypothetical protein